MKKLALLFLVLQSLFVVAKSNDTLLIKVAEGVHKKWGSDKDHRKVILVDFSKPLEEERLYIVDLDTRTIVKKTRVCHGIGSGEGSIPTKFSDTHGSKMSSKGVMRTSKTYYGSWGYSMVVDGLEKGVNGNARGRAIIFHNSDKQRAFWSWGCFSIPGEDSKKVIDMTKGGCLIYSFSTKEELLKYL